MNKYLFLFFTLFIIQYSYTQCPPGDVILSTQDEVDQFIIDYPTCEIINGDLNINSGVVNDISGLTSIKTIEGDLQISRTDITIISNFYNLEDIGGSFTITDNHGLLSIDQINQLESIGGDFNVFYSSLETVAGFSNLEFVGGYYSYVSNYNLLTVSGFENVTTINGSFVVANNNLLVDFPPFNNLQSVGSSFVLTDNDSLTDIRGFNALDVIDGQFLIEENNSLITIEGFMNLREVTSFFEIFINYDLETIPLFDSLVSVGSNFLISDSSITSISGFNNLVEIWGHFGIGGNNDLIIIDGFNRLEYINDALQIIANNSLESIIGFSSLAYTGGFFQIGSNPSLLSLTGLESLAQIGYIRVDEIVLVIESNDSLTDCSALCYILSINGVYGLAEFYNNPSDCSNQEEVEQGCIPDFDNDTILNDDDLDDDNDGILDTIEQNGIIDRDTDMDGLPDHMDIDSDNDGCFDAIESGFTDADLNGTLGSLPDNVDANGLITGEIDGYTTPLDVNMDSVLDFQQVNILSSGSDGILDICQDAISVDLIDSLEGDPDIGGTWEPTLMSGTGLFDPMLDTSGIYTYTINNGVCGSESSSVNVTISTIPNPGIDGVLDICENDSPVDLTDSLGGTPEIGGSWSPSLASSTNEFNPALDAAGTYIYTVTNGACGSQSSIVDVTLNLTPDSGINGVLDICDSDSSVDLIDSLGGSPQMGGVWSPSLLSGSGLFNPTIEESGIYIYTVMNSTCGSVSSQVDVLVHSTPDPGLNGILDICENEPLVDLIDYLDGTPDIDGVWNPVLASGTGIFNPTVDISGTYTYTVTNDYCGSESSTVDVVVYATPNSGTDGILDICENEPAVDLIDYLGDMPDIDGVWNPILASGTGIFNPSIDAAGTYTYTTNNSVCGSDFSTVEVTFTEFSPITDYSINIIEFENSNSIEIIINSDSQYEYSLDGNVFQDSNIFDNLQGGDYVVYVREINGCGILEEEVSILDFPRVFTPNGDGYNDEWKLKGKSSYEYSINIYDRYGKLLKHLPSSEKSWDGTFNGNMLSTNDYWFEVIFINGKVKTGHFTLKK